ncbi:MAG: hypothetical protein QW407_02345, partial [Thermofilaceae archaeon]
RAIYRSFRTATLTITGLRVRVDSIWVNVEASRDRVELSCESVEGADEIIDRFAEKVGSLIRELKGESVR